MYHHPRNAPEANLQEARANIDPQWVMLAICLLSGFLFFPIFIVVTLYLAKKHGRTVKKVGGFGFSVEFTDPEEPGANHN